MLGLREPGIYGKRDYNYLVGMIIADAAAHGDTVECYQSNHEGDIVDKIQKAYGRIDGIVINPAAYTHTSIAILDALKSVGIPAVEVHISDVNEREDFRRVSYAGMACFACVAGKGLDGYTEAMELLRRRESDGPRSETI